MDKQIELEMRSRSANEASVVQESAFELSAEARRRLENANPAVIRAYRFYTENRHLFTGRIWLPILDVYIPDQSDMDDVYSAIGLVDLYTFVCENFDDLQRFLGETKARGDRIGAGEVPSVQKTVCSDDAAKVVERFEAPEGLKRYLSTLLSFRINDEDEIEYLGTSYSEEDKESEEREIGSVIRKSLGNEESEEKHRDVQASREPAGDTGQSSGSSDNANSCCNSNTEPFSINDLDRVEQLATSVRYTSQAASSESDFGEANYILTQRMNARLLVLKSTTCKERVYLFRRTSSKVCRSGLISDYYRCIKCEAAKGGSVARTVVHRRCSDDSGRVVRDPEYGHSRNCVPVTTVDAEAMRMKREMRLSCQRGQRPMQAYQATVEEASLLATTTDDEVSLVSKIGSYYSNRSSLYKHTAKRCIPIPDDATLPIEYQVTYKSRQRLDDQTTEVEKLLLYEDESILIFSSPTNLEALHQSEYWVADGTFEKCPRPFSQLYTIHCFVNGEGVSACHALMKNRQRASYDTLFNCLETALVNKFGSIGIVHTMIMDFETASRAAATAAFKGKVRVRGCAFHFGQCIMRKIADLGLKVLYAEGAAKPLESGEGSSFFRWTKMLKGLAYFPPGKVRDTWRSWLQTIPRTASGITRHKFVQLRDYFETTWIEDPEAWNHFDSTWKHCRRMRGNPGPRTTNTAEGWHSRLNYELGHRHPALNTFMDWFQRVHHTGEVRIRQLFAGAMPKSRHPVYAKLDRQLQEARCGFLQQPVDVLINQQVHPVTKDFLKRVGFLLGGMKNTSAMGEPKSKEQRHRLKRTISDDRNDGAELRKRRCSNVSQEDPVFLGTKQGQVRNMVFKPTSGEWMRRKCEQLKIPLRTTRPTTDALPRTLLDPPMGPTEKIAGDGNCLFRTLSHLVSGSEESYRRVRQLICDQIANNAHRYLGSRNAKDYLENDPGMRNDTVWGTDKELSAAADLLSTTIWCFGPTVTIHRCAWTQFSPAENAFEESAYIVNIKNMHYEPLYSWY